MTQRIDYAKAAPGALQAMYALVAWRETPFYTERERAALAWTEALTLVGAVDRPINVLMGLSGVRLSLAELSEMGVKRISVGSALSRAALGGFLRAAREMRESGTFTFADEAVSYREVNAMLD